MYIFRRHFHGITERKALLFFFLYDRHRVFDLLGGGHFYASSTLLMTVETVIFGEFLLKAEIAD